MGDFHQWVVPAHTHPGGSVVPCLEPLLVKHPGPTLLLQATSCLVPEVEWRIPPSLLVLAQVFRESRRYMRFLLVQKTETSGEDVNDLLARFGSRKACDRSFWADRSLHYVLKQGANAHEIT